MKAKLMKLSIILAVLILVGTGTAFAGGNKGHYGQHRAPAFKGYHHGGKHHGGYRHHRADHHYRPGPAYHRFYHYGPPAHHYYHSYYSYYAPYYNGGSYFSGGYAEPGFGFFFGTRSGW